MPRYRLRTLLMIVTALAVIFARVAYLRQAAVYHRQQAALLVSQLSAREKFTISEAEDFVAFLATGATRLKSRVVTNGPEQKLLLESNAGGVWHVVQFEANLADWQAAVAHEIVAQRFDRAALRPWTVVTDSVAEITD